MNGKLVKLLKISSSAVVRSTFRFTTGAETGILLVGGRNFYKEVSK